MKRSILFYVLLLVLVVVLLAEDIPLLKVRAAIVPQRLARGQEGNVTLKFSIEEGMTISPQPYFRIELYPSEELVFPKDFFTASDLEMEIIEENGYDFLSLQESVSIPFMVRLEAKRGNHILRGRVKFFAFSREGGWCLKDKTEFSTTFYTSNRIYPRRK